MAGEVPPSAPSEESTVVAREAGLVADAGPVTSDQRVRALHDSESLSALDDIALVERAKADPEAFGALYERYARSVFAFAYSKVRDGSVAEDLTSQTFLQALRALPRYEQRGAPFRSWLFRIAANLIADRHRAPVAEVPLRRHASEGEDAAEPLDLEDPHAEEDITSWERAEAFARLVEGLTPEQRTVVHLRFVDGLPIADIAAKMARSEGSIKMLLMRALQNLRRTMAMETSNAG
jgi:RNA polymerase sigma-70 factor (ECF subfamily)